MAEKSLNTVCPHCGARNRLTLPIVPTDQPHCNKCRKRLVTDRALAVDDDRLRNFLRQDELPLLIDFWAPGCAPCKMMMPLLDQAAKKYATSLRVLKVNTAEFPAIIKTHRLRAVPTLILARKGRELDRVTGAMDGARLMRWIDKTGKV